MTPLPAQQMSDVERLVADLRLFGQHERLVQIDGPDGQSNAGLYDRAADLIERLRAEREGLRKNAERYRWIRLNGCHVALYSDDSFPFIRGSADLDTSIDKVLAATHADEAKGESHG